MAIISMDEAFADQIKEDYTGKQKRKPKRMYEGLKGEEFMKLLDFTAKQKHQIAFLLAYGSGLRLSEIINLKPEDIDLKANRIMVRQAKGSKDRPVNVPKGFKEKYLKLLPLNISGRAIEAAFLRNSIKAGINSKIGEYTTKNEKVMPLWKYRVHSLRHSFSVRALEKGIPINVLQQLLGHENISTTNRYTKVGATEAIQAIIDKGV